METIKASVPLMPAPPPSGSLGESHGLSRSAPSTTSRPTPRPPRRERPCDSCRRRKTRCVVDTAASTPASPVCALCTSLKQSCTFVENPAPRKRKLDTPSTTALPAPASRSTPPSPAHSRPPASATPSTTTTAPSRHRSPPSPSSVRRDGDDDSHHHTETSMSSPPGPEESTPSLADGILIGPSAHLDPQIAQLLAFDNAHHGQSQLGRVRRARPDLFFFAAASNPPPDPSIWRAFHDIIGPHASTLTELYFRFVHANYPVLDQHAFQQALASHTTIDPALLTAVYLNALDWWHFHSDANGPDVAQLERLADSLALTLGRQPSLASVQAGLLFLQRPRLQSWDLVCRVVAAAQDVGLHMDCSDWAIPATEKRVRKLVAWALYVQDKWSALTFGRPPHISRTDWAVEPLTLRDVDEDAHNTIHAQSGRSQMLTPPPSSDDGDTLKPDRYVFCQMIGLSRVVADILDDLYSQKATRAFEAAGPGMTRLILSKAKPLQIKLKAWFSALPVEAKMDSTGQMIGCKASLHLAYYAAEITMHRRIISSLDRLGPDDSQLVYICRSAAKARFISAMEFVNRLRPEHLQAFWYYPSAANFALIGTFGSLLRVTAPGQDEAEFYAARLQEYAWTLRMSSARAPFLHATVDTLNALYDILRDLHVKPSVTDAGPGQHFSTSHDFTISSSYPGAFHGVSQGHAAHTVHGASEASGRGIPSFPRSIPTSRSAPAPGGIGLGLAELAGERTVPAKEMVTVRGSEQFDVRMTEADAAELEGDESEADDGVVEESDSDDSL